MHLPAAAVTSADAPEEEEAGRLVELSAYLRGDTAAVLRPENRIGGGLEILLGVAD